jgi:hypothetical protein
MYTTQHEEDLLRERIRSLIHMEKLTENSFAKQINRQPTNVYQVLTGERRFPRGFVGDILKAFPKVNKEWLVFGEGTMYGDPKIVQIDTKPLLPRTISDGNLIRFYAGEKRSECTERPVISRFPEYDFSLKLKSHRMTPRYESGDELFFKKVEIKEWGDNYLIDTPEGPKFGRLYEDEAYYKLVTYQPDIYPETKIPKNKVLGFYRCVGSLSVL